MGTARLYSHPASPESRAGAVHGMPGTPSMRSSWVARRVGDASERRDTWLASARGLWREVRSLLPEGRGLPDDVWARRHRGVLILLWVHVVGLAVFGLLTGNALVHSLAESAL